jgi:hypothetical protein
MAVIEIRDRRLTWRSFAALSGLALALLLSACEKPRDHYRENIDTMRGWSDSTMSRLKLELPGIKDRVTRVERQGEELTHLHERLFLDGDKGVIYLHYVADVAQTEDDRHRIYSSFWFRNWIKNYFGSTLLDFSTPVEFVHEQDLGRGYYSVVDVSNSKVSCFAARAGYKLGVFGPRGGRVEPHAFDARFDTVVEFLYCDPRVSPREFIPLLTMLDLRAAGR